MPGIIDFERGYEPPFALPLPERLVWPTPLAVHIGLLPPPGLASGEPPVPRIYKLEFTRERVWTAPRRSSIRSSSRGEGTARVEGELSSSTAHSHTKEQQPKTAKVYCSGRRDRDWSVFEDRFCDPYMDRLLLVHNDSSNRLDISPELEEMLQVVLTGDGGKMERMRVKHGDDLAGLLKEVGQVHLVRHTPKPYRGTRTVLPSPWSSADWGQKVKESPFKELEEREKKAKSKKQKEAVQNAKTKKDQWVTASRLSHRFFFEQAPERERDARRAVKGRC